MPPIVSNSGIFTQGGSPNLPPDVKQKFEYFAAPQPTTLTIDLDNVTAYFQDSVDLASLAKQTTPVSITPPNNFASLEVVGDIVRINGDTRVSGLYLSKNIVTMSSPTATPGSGMMIADAKIVGFRHDIVKILYPDPDPAVATPIEIGSITAEGVSGQPPIPPGGPLEIAGGDWAITGGTGAFLGVTGQMGGQGPHGTPAAARNTSVTEDPSYRRINVSNAANASPPPPPATATFYLNVIPLMPPQIIAVFHGSPLRPVTQTDPASVGETLFLYATGLGPVRYQSGSTWVNLPIGQQFSGDTRVISPVRITIGNRKFAPEFAGGYQDFTNGYGVQFTVPGPPLASPVTTTIQISSAWIQSAAVPLYLSGAEIHP